MTCNICENIFLEMSSSEIIAERAKFEDDETESPQSFKHPKYADSVLKKTSESCFSESVEDSESNKIKTDVVSKQNSKAGSSKGLISKFPISWWLFTIFSTLNIALI